MTCAVTQLFYIRYVLHAVLYIDAIMLAIKHAVIHMVYVIQMVSHTLHHSM